jgi:hypothetical protein
MKVAQRDLALAFVELRKLLGDEELMHLFPLAKDYADHMIVRRG